ncbi:MAG: hypothetical protein RR271_04045, partial [Oscillospiraceae bacterium]
IAEWLHSAPPVGYYNGSQHNYICRFLTAKAETENMANYSMKIRFYAIIIYYQLVNEYRRNKCV